MIGAIIGDIVGSKYEFNNIRTKDFPLFSSGCGYTDDTICTIAVADALLTGTPFAERLQHWCRKYPHPKGAYGGSFARWIFMEDPKPYGSYGNGSAMRVSPCGYLETAERVGEAARLSAECTHNHPEGIKGAVSVAEVIFRLRHGASKDEIRAYVTEQFGYNLSQTVDSIRRTNRFDETCQVTVPQSFVCFLESTGFEDAIRNAISIGGDSDTIGAITGSLAEAFYGVPESLRKVAITYLPGEFVSVLDAFNLKFAL